MPEPSISARDERLVDELAEYYLNNRHDLKTFLRNFTNQVRASKELKPWIHSVKSRMKDPDHLKDKLKRKILEYKKKKKIFPINESNLFRKINDLAGLRILHLHTTQVKAIHDGLAALFLEERYRITEGPTARTWDDESRDYFRKVGIKTKKSPSLYTSVHYIIRPNKTTPYTCEIQVRTLMEEVWGEVDHTINYPHRTAILACSEQIAALARATSACTRLVDSIFRSHSDLTG
jgi:ppGpp synthetase/RelA/SpoT-type nucleotidyltranferase